MIRNFKKHLVQSMLAIIPLCLCYCVFPNAIVAQNQWATNGDKIHNTNAGNVGVGTSDPKETLHVNTTNGLSTIRVQGGAANAGYIAMWDPGQLLLLTNNRIPSTGNNTNTTTNGAQLGLWGGDFSFATTSSGTVGNWTELARLRANGNFGIGTSSAAHKLDVAGVIRSSSGGFMFPDGTVQTTAGGSQWTTSSTNIFYASGNVGIGNTAPLAKLHVTGDGRVTGNFTVDGNIAAKYQDVAEWVPASEQLPAGTVVAIDPTKSNHVEASSEAYDTRVAGVISAQPGIALGEQSEKKVLVATTGRVRIKVVASNPIKVGDLLVTSNIPGVAMKSQPLNIGGVRMHRPGTVIGKALEPLATGTGEILVLLSLQ